MNCMNCGAFLADKDLDYCPRCGCNVLIQKKVDYLSRHYYNMGLEKASVRDLSGAISCLKQSLIYNKHNIQARNLLGLVYFETGEVVSALSEWVISKNLQPTRNLATESQACLSVEQKTVTRTSRNVVARIEGTDRAEEILTLTAHYDSVPEGPGAYDNMSGGAIIMELCRYFQMHRPRRTMEFVWFGAEEKGLLGSQSYIKVHETELPAHRFNMNVDLAGQLVGGTVVGVTGDASVCNMITYMAHEIGIGMSTKNQIWGSDSNTFAWKGIPEMTLNRDGFGMHTRHDTIALLSDWSLERSAILLGYIADRLGNIDSFPFERKVPEEFITQLDEYFG